MTKNKIIASLFSVMVAVNIAIFSVSATVISANQGYYDNFASGAHPSSGIQVNSNSGNMNIVYDRDLDSYSSGTYIKANLTSAYITVEGASAVILGFTTYQRCNSSGVNNGPAITYPDGELWNATFEINITNILGFIPKVNWREIHEATNIYHKEED
ncbi:hypothetical protein FACS1894132_03600 [Clostridia bacterium]|nr:hypothetical protein FACS1894132_03600 [Clostridia bacterium]